MKMLWVWSCVSQLRTLFTSWLSRSDNHSNWKCSSASTAEVSTVHAKTNKSRVRHPEKIGCAKTLISWVELKYERKLTSETGLLLFSHCSSYFRLAPGDTNVL